MDFLAIQPGKLVEKLFPKCRIYFIQGILKSLLPITYNRLPQLLSEVLKEQNKKQFHPLPVEPLNAAGRRLERHSDKKGLQETAPCGGYTRELVL